MLNSSSCKQILKLNNLSVCLHFRMWLGLKMVRVQQSFYAKISLSPAWTTYHLKCLVQESTP